MKNILIISESILKAGAGNASQNIFNFFSKNSVAKLLVPIYSNKYEKNVLSYYNNLTIFYFIFIKSIIRIISYSLSKNKFFFFNNIFRFSLFSAKKIKRIINDFHPDYVIILWYESILNYKEILKIKKELNTKIIIYPFDMFSFTGGCRYVQSCNQFNKECIKCPAIKLKNTAHHNYLSNKNYLKKIDPIFLFPSQYALKFSQATNILQKSIKKFIFYYPSKTKNKTQYIKSFDIGDLIYNKKKKEKLDKVVFFGAQDGREWRKGIFNLINIIETFKIKYPDIYSKTLFIFTGNYIGDIFDKIDNNFITLGFIEHSKIIELYKISDIIIIPSLQEWSSLMLLEVFSLNKVIFCFNTGSAGDFIVNEINGNIFEPFDYNEFHYQFNKYLIKKKMKLINNQSIKKKIIDSNNKIISYLDKN
jgi:hypothetical protein